MDSQINRLNGNRLSGDVKPLNGFKAAGFRPNLVPHSLVDWPLAICCYLVVTVAPPDKLFDSKRIKIRFSKLVTCNSFPLIGFFFVLFLSGPF